MPKNFKHKKDKIRVTIETRNGKLVKVTTLMHRKARDREEVVEPYNPLSNVKPPRSIWDQR